ncbi:bifunctional diguanylate cyclase/phosphodiesterase [Sporosarcina sp. FSL K6-3457]|uniref:bifunctional diguanylate cyclase/phosphodiesterase n=1 Tax=Sporosarcina sp. FSL K6-3457 TaxID=2978204 RepID=UPI0030F5E845
MGINGKVVIAMLVVVLSTMLTIAFYSHSMTKDILIDQVERELAFKNENIKNTITSTFQRKGEVVRQLASIPVIESFMSANEKREDVRANKDYEWIQQALTRAQENNEHVQQIWLSHIENSYFITDHDQVSDESFFIQERHWYEQASQTEGISYSSLYIDYVTKKQMISIVYPVIVDNERLGYFGMDIFLDDLAALLQPFEQDGRKLTLVSGQGDILYDPKNMRPALREAQVEGQEIAKFQSSGESYYASVRQLNELGWKIAVSVPESTLLQPLATYEQSIIGTWVIAIIILLATLSFVLHYLLKDIPFIVHQINKIKHGDLSVKIGIERKDEVGEIARAVEQMALQIKSQVDELDYQASHDSLTGLANRHSIEKVLQQWIDEVNTDEEMIAVLFLDLDQFKHVNDSKGHAFGDKLLIEVGKRISDLLPKNSFFGRFGGDEFVVIIRTEKGALDRIYYSLQQVYESFTNPFLLFDQNTYITASIGVSLYPSDAQSIGELFVDADTALYHAKEQGRNRIYFFNNDMKDQIERELKLKDGLREALLHEELFLHYQPQLDMTGGKKASVEALIRWKHPELGMVSPADFIPLAENTGQIIAIGDWVLDASLQMIKRATEQGINIQHVAVNVSAIQLREADFVDKVQKKLEYYDIEPSLLEIEITESIIIEHQEETIRRLNELKRLGIQIALDDFGTGYSSLNYLRLMPIDRVKVDRSFIQQIEEDSIVQAILTTIVSLGHSLGFQIVAEGVEEASQLQILRDMKVDTVQGYYYSRPLDEDTLLDFLRQQ